MIYRSCLQPPWQIQPPGVNSKVGLRAGNWPSSFTLQRETVAAGPSFPASVISSGWPDNRIQDDGPTACGSECAFFFLLLAADALTRYSKVKPVAKGEDPSSVFTSSSDNVFRKRLVEVWTEVFPHLLVWFHVWHNSHLPASLSSLHLQVSSGPL